MLLGPKSSVADLANDEHIIAVLLENEPGALSRVVGPVLGARLQHRDR